MIAVIVNAWWKKINVGSIRKLSELYTTETVDLLFYPYIYKACYREVYMYEFPSGRLKHVCIFTTT